MRGEPRDPRRARHSSKGRPRRRPSGRWEGPGCDQRIRGLGFDGLLPPEAGPQNRIFRDVTGGRPARVTTFVSTWCDTETGERPEKSGEFLLPARGRGPRFPMACRAARTDDPRRGGNNNDTAASHASHRRAGDDPGDDPGHDGARRPGAGAGLSLEADPLRRALRGRRQRRRDGAHRGRGHDAQAGPGRAGRQQAGRRRRGRPGAGAAGAA